MDLRDYFRVVRKRWFLIALLTLVGVAGAALASLLIQPKYEARTLSFVAVQNGGTVQELAQGATYAQNIIRSFQQAVGTPAVLDAVLADPRLNLGDESIESLAARVVASATLNTVNLEIAVTDPDPVQAANIANAVTASFARIAPEITQPASGEPSPVTVTILAPASEPTAPVSPNTRLNLVLGLLIGLAIGLAVALLIEVLDTRIRSEQHVRAITDAPILGGIAFDKLAPRRPLIVQTDPSSPGSEAFRTLRTNLQFLDVEGGARSFVVTSSIPAEGKSTTVANLALAVAQSGARVIVIDADLRSPSLANLFGLEGAVGLTDVLIGRVKPMDAIQTWGHGGLAVLPAGRIPPNPSELVGSRTMAALIRALEQQFDVVLIDSPPLLPATDAALLAKHVRGAIVVVASGKTHRGQFAGAISALEGVDAAIMGVVVTMLPTGGPGAYGYGRYGYGAYGYGYGYGKMAGFAERAYAAASTSGPASAPPPAGGGGGDPEPRRRTTAVGGG